MSVSFTFRPSFPSLLLVSKEGKETSRRKDKKGNPPSFPPPQQLMTGIPESALGLSTGWLVGHRDRRDALVFQRHRAPLRPRSAGTWVTLQRSSWVTSEGAEKWGPVWEVDEKKTHRYMKYYQFC